MPRPPDPASQRATAEFFALRPDRLCRLLQRHGVDYQDRPGVAEMLRRGTSMSPATRKAVDEVLQVETADTTTKAPVTELETLEAMAENEPGEVGTVEEAEAYLRTLKRSMRIAEQTSEQLRQAELFEDARRWLQVHAGLAKQYPSLHKQVMALRREHKQTIRAEDAQKAFTGFLMRMRDLTERMPAALSGRVAPFDSEGARIQLEIWVRDVFCKSLNQSPDVTQ